MNMMMMMMNMMMTTRYRGTIHVPLYIQPIYYFIYTSWVSEGHRFLERTKYASSGVFLSS